MPISDHLPGHLALHAELITSVRFLATGDWNGLRWLVFETGYEDEPDEPLIHDDVLGAILFLVPNPLSYFQKMNLDKVI